MGHDENSYKRSDVLRNVIQNSRTTMNQKSCRSLSRSPVKVPTSLFVDVGVRPT